MKNNFLKQLCGIAGNYTGVGTNHEGKPFIGLITLTPLFGGRGVSLYFKATGKDGTLYHEEHSVIAPDLLGELGLYNLNSNMPGLVHHRLARIEGGKAVFAFGQAEEKSAFREEITLELLGEGGLEYHYAWGMPGGEFADRSGAVMKRE